MKFDEYGQLTNREIDIYNRLYPNGDDSFGEFIPGESSVQMHTFSFIPQEKILSTFNIVTIEYDNYVSYEENL